MFKLPVCPYCGTIYRYKETKAAVKEKDNECYHCHKKFKAKLLPFALIDAAIVIVLSIGANLLILSRSTTLNVFVLFLVTLGFLLIGYLLLPFFARFVKTDDKTIKKR